MKKVKTRKVKAVAPSRVARWRIGYLDVVKKEAQKHLTDEQYAHVIGLIEELACEDDPTKSQTQHVEKIENFYELKDKGGILGKINVRVYFILIPEQKLVLTLKFDKKEQDGKPSRHAVTSVRNRLRQALKQLT